MLSTAPGKSTPVAKSAGRRHSLITQKVWLPQIVYRALPWFYVGAGIAAFLATLYINTWFWILPHYLLFSIACVHLGLLVYRRRRRHVPDEA